MLAQAFTTTYSKVAMEIWALSLRNSVVTTLSANFAQIEQVIDLPQQVVGRNMILKAKVVEKSPLIRRLPTHHRPIPPIRNRKDRITLPASAQALVINGIGQNRT